MNEVTSKTGPWRKGISEISAAATGLILDPWTIVEPKQIRRIRLLSAFLLLMALITLANSTSLLRTSWSLGIFMLVTSIVLVGGYLLGRTKYWKIGVMLAIVVPVTNATAAVIFQSSGINLLTTMIWLVLPLLIASLMMTAWKVLIVTVLYLAFISVLALFSSFDRATVVPLIAFMVFVSVFVIAISAVREKDHAEIENQLIERQKTEKALRESEEKFSKAFRTSGNQITISRMKDGVFIEVNDAFTKMNGYTREEVIGRNPIEIGLWSDEEDMQRILKKIQENASVRNEQLRIRTKAGEILTGIYSSDEITIAGEPCFMNSITDITELKKAEKSLKESEEKFSKAFQASPDAMSISSVIDGTFIEINNSFTRITGYTHEELIGKNADSFNMWADANQRTDMIQKIQASIKLNNEEFAFRVKSGQIRTMLASTEYINIGGVACLLVVSSDITDLKESEKQLKQAVTDLERSSVRLQSTNNELESFSYSVSHDLRSPLRAIDGFSQALLEDYSDKLDEKGQDYLKRLRNAGQKMGELIDGLLKLSRLTRAEFRRDNVDLSKIVEEISTRLHQTFPARKVDFIITNDLHTKGDPQMIRVLLENLLSNAMKFTKNIPVARIEFGSSTNGEGNMFFIKDNGAGFEMAFKDKLFGAFQRLHDSKEFPGTGIGLATVQRIINRHGGSIRAEGEPGKGASFYFSFEPGGKA